MGRSCSHQFIEMILQLDLFVLHHLSQVLYHNQIDLFVLEMDLDSSKLDYISALATDHLQELIVVDTAASWLNELEVLFLSILLNSLIY